MTERFLRRSHCLSLNANEKERYGESTTETAEEKDHSLLSGEQREEMGAEEETPDDEK